MQHRKSLATAATTLVAGILTTSIAIGSPEVAGPIATLLVQPHVGANSIDVSGQTAAGEALTVTLVSTIDYDLPDVVLSRTALIADRTGAYSGTISVAPGFTRGSIITVYVTSPGSAKAASARFNPDSPNRGVVIPLDVVPRAAR